MQSITDFHCLFQFQCWDRHCNKQESSNDLLANTTHEHNFWSNILFSLELALERMGQTFSCYVCLIGCKLGNTRQFSASFHYLSALLALLASLFLSVDSPIVTKGIWVHILIMIWLVMSGTSVPSIGSVTQCSKSLHFFTAMTVGLIGRQKMKNSSPVHDFESQLMCSWKA